MSEKNKSVGLLVMAVVLLIGLGYLIYGTVTAEQCPQEYTQEQVDESGCIVGANIGLGLVAIIYLPAVIFVFMFVYNKFKQLFGKKNEQSSTDQKT